MSEQTPQPDHNLPPLPQSEMESWAAPAADELIATTHEEVVRKEEVRQQNDYYRKLRSLREQVVAPKQSKHSRHAVPLELGPTRNKEPWDDLSAEGKLQRMEHRLNIAQNAGRAAVEHATRLSELAYIDELTGIPNRQGLEHWFEYNRPKVAGIMLLDMVKFKGINEAFGQTGGDAALKRAPQGAVEKIVNKLRIYRQDKLAHEERRSNTGKDMIGRYGGDEFLAVVNLDDVPLEKRTEVMSRIAGELMSPMSFTYQNKEVPLQMHAVWEIPEDPNDGLDESYERLGPQLPSAKQSQRQLNMPRE